MGRTVPACVHPCKRPRTYLTLILLSSRSNTGWAKICHVVILHTVRTTDGINNSSQRHVLACGMWRARLAHHSWHRSLKGTRTAASTAWAMAFPLHSHGNNDGKVGEQHRPLRRVCRGQGAGGSRGAAAVSVPEDGQLEGAGAPATAMHAHSSTSRARTCEAAEDEGRGCVAQAGVPCARSGSMWLCVSVAMVMHPTRWRRG